MPYEAGSTPLFTLEYEVQSEDLREVFAASPLVKRRLISAVVAASLWGLSAASFTGITIKLIHRLGTNSPNPLLGGSYLVDLALWFVTALSVLTAWRRSTGRLARAAVMKSPAFQGRTCDQVEVGGIRGISANGIEVFRPWATISQVRETPRAFHLLDDRGRVQVVLPKRGLDDPDLLPALRSFVEQAVAQQPPTATASTASEESQS